MPLLRRTLRDIARVVASRINLEIIRRTRSKLFHSRQPVLQSVSSNRKKIIEEGRKRERELGVGRVADTPRDTYEIFMELCTSSPLSLE